MASFTIGQKRVDVYPGTQPNSPVIYLNTFSNAVGSVYKNMMGLGCPDFSFVAVSKLKWDHDMTPWYMGPISKHDTPCTGGGDDYLELLLEEIMPQAEILLSGTPAWRGAIPLQVCLRCTPPTKPMCFPEQPACPGPSGSTAFRTLSAPMR